MRRKRRFPWTFLILLVFIIGGLNYLSDKGTDESYVSDTGSSGTEIFSDALSTAQSLLEGEPEEVTELRNTSPAATSDEHQEYYFSLLSEEQQVIYRQMLNGIEEREEDFYLTIAGGDEVDLIYRAVLNDHPELFWIHNREKVYTTSYSGKDYCKFSPGYTYTDEEITEIQQSMETAFQNVYARLSSESDTYEKVRVCYDYLIDHVEYVSSDDDQNIAGAFWKNQAVCAGYARGLQYLLERLDVTCIYVEGDTRGSEDGHAWDLVEIDGQYYIVDPTNGDQPQFLEGDAVQLAEHKTILYDYLCPFPEEYAQMYTASTDFAFPQCTSTDKNFYVMNQACFDSYDYNTIYNFCCMRIDNGAAVIRFKFSSQEAYESACAEWINNSGGETAAQYYMKVNGLSTVQFHYGVLDDLKTIYFIF